MTCTILSNGNTASTSINMMSNNITSVGTISGSTATFTNVNANTFNASSDYRIKKNIEPINITEYNVNKLNPVHYYNIISNKKDLGFIAHEVQPYFPMLVNGNKDEDAYQSINYSGLIPILVKEIQDLKKEISNIKDKLLKYEK